MSEGSFERLARLALRHGDDAMRECVEAALDLAEAEGRDRVRQMATAVTDGGLIPDGEALGTSSCGRPRNPDAGLMAVWATVEATREAWGLSSVNAACRELAKTRGTRRNPIPGGITLSVDGEPRRWDNPETLRSLHRDAVGRRNTDPDFAAMCDLIYPEVLRRMTPPHDLGEND